MTAKVSVIIPTYKRPESLKRTLMSLKGNGSGKTEVIVVEQGEPYAEDVCAEVRKMGLPVTYIHESAIGMTHARNVGFRASSGEIVIYFDDDVTIHAGCVKMLVEVFSDSAIGMAGARVITPGQPLEPGRKDTGKVSFWGSFSDGFSSETPQDVDTVIGCGMAIRRSVLENIGGFDERFSASAIREETDVAFRIRKSGYGIRFEPRAIVTHHREQSGGARKSEGRIRWYYDFFSNETYFCLKHRPLFVLPVYLAKRSEFALRCMFGFGREVSFRSLLTPIAGSIDGIRKYTDECRH